MEGEAGEAFGRIHRGSFEHAKVQKHIPARRSRRFPNVYSEAQVEGHKMNSPFEPSRVQLGNASPSTSVGIVGGRLCVNCPDDLKFACCFALTRVIA